MLALAFLKQLELDPRLAGVQPFPKLDDWRADGALYAHQSLKSRVTEHDSAPAIVDGFNALDREAWTQTLLRPEVFAFIGSQPTRWDWSELAGALRIRSTVEAGIITVSKDPGPKFRQILRESGIGSRRKDCANADFLPPEGSEHTRWRGVASAAGVLISQVVPGYAADLAGAVDQVALVDEGASFRGSSGVIHRGMVFLSPEDDWGVGVFAEELIHEATHNLLDLVSLRRALISGDDVYVEQFPAPFRPDKRHLYGNLHAVIVVARLIHFFLALSEADPSDLGKVAREHDWIARAGEYGRSSLEPLESVCAHPGLSPLGRHLIDRLVVPTIAYAAKL